MFSFLDTSIAEAFSILQCKQEVCHWYLSGTARKHLHSFWEGLLCLYLSKVNIEDWRVLYVLLKINFMINLYTTQFSKFFSYCAMPLPLIDDETSGSFIYSPIIGTLSHLNFRNPLPGFFLSTSFTLYQKSEMYHPE